MSYGKIKEKIEKIKWEKKYKEFEEKRNKEENNK